MLTMFTQNVKFIAFALIWTMPSAANAEALQPPTNAAPMADARCELSAWLRHQPGRDVLVRGAPNEDSQVVARFADDEQSEHADPQDAIPALSLEIHEAKSQWLRVTIYSEDSDTAAEATATQGWIQADDVRFGIQSGRGYLAATTDSKRVVDLSGDWATEIGVIEQMRGCQNEWVLIDYRQTLYRAARDGPDGDALKNIPSDAQKTVRAWFRGTCGNQWTSCDMTSVDRD